MRDVDLPRSERRGKKKFRIDSDVRCQAAHTLPVAFEPVSCLANDPKTAGWPVQLTASGLELGLLKT